MTPAAVIFVVMPFAERISPALGVSLLKSALAVRGIPARVLYPSLRFARTIGATAYDEIAYGRPRTDALVGEWLFSHVLRDARASAGAAYIATTLGACEPVFRESVLAARERAEEFVAACADEILALAPAIVGFTSSFQQHVPSLALAKRLKQRAPHITILFGGANCEGEMGRETLARFAFVDAVVSGEGDAIVPILVERLLHGEPIGTLPGVYARSAATSLAETTPVVLDMDALPYPDFSDYFASIESGAMAETRLNFETSRGCWWGEKSHCTFCGLNGSTMVYRKKSPARAIDEIEHLTRTYDVRKLAATDNILDAGYFTTVLAELPRRRLAVELFYETKSNLRKEQIRALAEAGVRSIQPGIESLSSPVLALMRKGVTALRNVQTLKWCKAYGIAVTWNLLYGFPGESPEAYRAMERLVPLLTHLTPPSFAGPLRLDRYSPMFEDPEAFGLIDIEPAAAYAEIYDLPASSLRKLAYYFSYGHSDRRDPQMYASGLERCVAAWKAAHGTSDLIAIDDGTTTIVCDYRPVAAAALSVLDGFERSVYLACDELRSVEQVRAHVLGAGFSNVSTADVDTCLASFVERRLLVREGSVALALAVILGDHASPAILARFGAIATAFA